jgi:hypothetical protein
LNCDFSSFRFLYTIICTKKIICIVFALPEKYAAVTIETFEISSRNSHECISHFQKSLFNKDFSYLLCRAEDLKSKLSPATSSHSNQKPSPVLTYTQRPRPLGDSLKEDEGKSWSVAGTRQQPKAASSGGGAGGGGGYTKEEIQVLK